ncbi:hypothetical protein BCR34DRAFT_598132 [Clohesyomyces aquaticus]|uniref:WSC domain-containing protein n=1 Tax=Clohesyomyces aquaticus TaxID=1231657 RepID=A0A1Y2A030_9PLEO|nr:hypothetical protein BCR34DRAFT_598132 [Clohesyomyces aquaticus]
MVSTRTVAAFAAASLFSMAAAQDTTPSSIVSIPTPTASATLNAMTEIGCFSTGTPLEDHGSWTFQTSGNCQPICVLLQKPVMGLVDGSNCWCGDLIPPKAAKVANSSCNTPCNGFDKQMCGGPSMWWISLTGLTKNHINNYDPASASSSSSKGSAPTSAAAGQTVVVTASETPTQGSGKQDSGPNKAGIAAGVVVGVVALCAIIGGVMLFLRQKRRRAVEEEYRRQAAVNQFVSGGKLHTSNSSMTDSRLDPEFMMRRASNGSIADNEDYSRRILKVTNPDGH